MAKLFILGDSFSFPHKTEKKLWPVIAGEQLSKKIGSKVEVVNHSLIGASQDYVWKQLDNILPQITADDYLMIILTSCDRFWYFEKRPEYSNLMSLENIAQVTEDQNLQAALITFITQVWRHSLAVQLQNHRLGYLSYKILKQQLKRPLIIKGFEYVIDNELDFPELNFSHHSLAKIQLNEFEKFEGEFVGEDILLGKEYWHHIDCRYNHMCLSNHTVLGNAVSEGLYNGSTVTLGSDEYHKSIITVKNCKDKDFAANEFCLKYFNEMLSNSIRQKLGAKSFKLFF
jgi:hypothetical protein